MKGHAYVPSRVTDHVSSLSHKHALAIANVDVMFPRLHKRRGSGAG